jgi:hypothetical protein
LLCQKSVPAHAGLRYRICGAMAVYCAQTPSGPMMFFDFPNGFERYPRMWGNGCLLRDSPLAIHTAAFVHVLVLLAAGLALYYGESNNLT